MPASYTLGIESLSTNNPTIQLYKQNVIRNGIPVF